MKTSLNLNNPFNLKIKQEKRRRHQVYSLFDFYLSSFTIFDFLSFDSFRFLKDSYLLSKLTNKEKIGTDFLLLSFFQKDSTLLKTLNQYGLDDNFVQNLIKKLLPQKYLDVKEQNDFFISFSKLNFLEKKDISQNILYSQELYNLLEKSAENALIRFKTPIITSEILFITLMEDKNSIGGKLIKDYFSSNSEWFLLRYRLMKQLHNHESTIKGEVSKNQQYFAYVLKTKLSETLFSKLILTEKLGEAVNSFRNFIFKDILRINIFELLSDEIYKSIELNKTRKYSS